MIEDILGSAICAACIACYLPWVGMKWRRRTWLRRSRGWPVPVPREPARPWTGQVPRVPPRFMTSSEWRSWDASQSTLPPVTIQGGQHGSVREAMLAREASLRQAPPPSPAEQRQRMAAQQPEPKRLAEVDQERIRALNGRTPTYWEAVEIMGLIRRWGPPDPFIGTPGKHEVVWRGPGGVTVLKPEMHTVIKP